MKVCPVCSESFGDELNFCDIDGVRLTRNRDVMTTQDRSRAWSMVGAGLMLGALVLSAVMIFFFPKSPMSPMVVSSQPTSASSASQPSTTQPSSADSQVAALPEVVVEETPPVEVKKKEKPASLTDANANSSALNPKAAALEAEGANTNPRPAASEPPPVITPRPEPPPPPKTVSEERAPEPVLKPVQTGEVKKDSKAASKDKDSNKKKDDKEKKKGGFFGVFKKIFGKDDKKN